jgi:hypothetical protein
VFAADPGDTAGAMPYCGVPCWSADMDENTPITPPAGRPRMLRAKPPLPWALVAARHPGAGRPGITAETAGTVDVLLYRDAAGALTGVLYHRARSTPTGERLPGELSVWVDPDRQRQGTGTKLTREAGRRWGVNLAAQRFTVAGLALARRALPPDRQI